MPDAKENATDKDKPKNNRTHNSGAAFVATITLILVAFGLLQIHFKNVSDGQVSFHKDNAESLQKQLDNLQAVQDENKNLAAKWESQYHGERIELLGAVEKSTILQSRLSEERRQYKVTLADLQNENAQVRSRLAAAMLTSGTGTLSNQMAAFNKVLEDKLRLTDEIYQLKQSHATQIGDYATSISFLQQELQVANLQIVEYKKSTVGSSRNVREDNSRSAAQSLVRSLTKYGHDDDKLRAIESALPRIEGGITGNDLASLIGSIRSNGDKVRALKAAQKYVQRPIDAKSIETIISSFRSDSDRSRASSILYSLQ
ncbi:DUF4476 domain-containing protein [Candidatus Sumerlaeota bacterium]